MEPVLGDDSYRIRIVDRIGNVLAFYDNNLSGVVPDTLCELTLEDSGLTMLWVELRQVECPANDCICY
jgi:hypothetical protein